LIVIGTPAATPLAPAMLMRMSLRTMPESSKALAMPLLFEFEPSPGYGPAVSSGITEQLALEPDVLLDPDDELLESVLEAADAVPLPPQPIKGSEAAAPAASQRSACRRFAAEVNRTSRSCARPWS
jgi:hypothetical protein